MSYPRNMAGALALLATSSLLGLGCAVAAADPADDVDEQGVAADQMTQGQDESASPDQKDAKGESTGESKDALWGFGYPFYGYGYGAFGYPFYGYGYPLYGYGYPLYGYGYPFYGYRGWW
jgi:hypothetical protein